MYFNIPSAESKPTTQAVLRHGGAIEVFYKIAFIIIFVLGGIGVVRSSVHQYDSGVLLLVISPIGALTLTVLLMGLAIATYDYEQNVGSEYYLIPRRRRAFMWTVAIIVANLVFTFIEHLVLLRDGMHGKYDRDSIIQYTLSYSQYIVLGINAVFAIYAYVLVHAGFAYPLTEKSGKSSPPLSRGRDAMSVYPSIDLPANDIAVTGNRKAFKIIMGTLAVILVGLAFMVRIGFIIALSDRTPPHIMTIISVGVSLFGLVFAFIALLVVTLSGEGEFVRDPVEGASAIASCVFFAVAFGVLAACQGLALIDIDGSPIDTTAKHFIRYVFTVRLQEVFSVIAVLAYHFSVSKPFGNNHFPIVKSLFGK